MYGLTEAIRTSYLDPALFAAKRGALGRAIPNSEVFVVDEKGRACPPGVTGELIQRGPTVARGYWNRPEASAERFRPCPGLGPYPDDEIFCWSGDLGRIDEDGILWFVGRQDFMIKSSGVRVSPTEVEEFLYRVAGVHHAIAFGVPDDALGACVEAVVVPDTGAGLAEKDILRFCRREMPGYMAPRRIHVWDGELPRTGNGKINVPAVVQTITSRSAQS
jgi:acyl-CoA synthetase (AMP-forming)/AMP-acid ligase II